tara:strand:+ start:723 stop:884 length:162 start_codon:yes stop_codon:yes gene_type:complete
MFERLTDEQFEYVLNVLIEYKKMNRDKDVYLNEKSLNDAREYFKKCGSELFNQ